MLRAFIRSFVWFSLSKKPFRPILAFATGFVFTIGVRWFYGYYFSTLHTHTFLWLMIIFFVCAFGCIDNSSFFYALCTNELMRCFYSVYFFKYYRHRASGKSFYLIFKKTTTKQNRIKDKLKQFDLQKKAQQQ